MLKKFSLKNQVDIFKNKLRTQSQSNSFLLKNQVNIFKNKLRTHLVCWGSLAPLAVAPRRKVPKFKFQSFV